MSENVSVPKKSVFLPVSLAVFVLAVAVASIYVLEPPRPLPVSAPDTVFSAERAWVHDRVIAAVPHPAGSPANTKVAAYLVDTMRSLGIDTEFYTDHYVRGHSAGAANIVLARIPGTANTKAFALMAHYDSVPYGPGATDDLGGVVAMIETARALKAGKPLMNDVIFAFTDAEESSGNGAQAFCDHPWADEVGVIVNLEARGNRGTSMMFETSPENGWLIAELAKSGVPACASSLMFDVYKRMPFNSDFSATKRRGIPGMNIAFVDNFAHYHTMNDNPDTANLASVQHHGEYTLGLARHFGNIPLGSAKAPDAIYFNTFGFHVLHYPLSWGLPLAILSALVLLGMLLFGFVRHHLTVRGVLGGIVAFPIVAVCVCAAVMLMLTAIYGPETVKSLYTENFTYLPNLRALYYNNVYGTAFAAMTVAVAVFLYGLFSRAVRPQNLAAGALIWWLAPLAALVVLLPGGSFYAMWPMLFASLGLALLFLARDPDHLPEPLVALSVLFTVPGILLFAPGYRSLLSTVMIIAGPALAVLLLLLLTLLIPQIAVMTRPNRWWLPLIAASAAIVLLVFGLVTNTPSPTRPDLDSVAYGVNLDTGKAYWMTADEETDEWTEQFFPPDTPKERIDEFLPHNDEMYKKAPAPLAMYLAGPNIEVVRDTPVEGGREVVLRVTSPNAAAWLELRVTSPTKVLAASIFGKPIEPADAGWRLRMHVFPPEGVELTLKTDAAGPLAINAIETFNGQPEIPSIRPRPPHIVPEPNTIRHGIGLRGEYMYVTRTFTFPAPQV